MKILVANLGSTSLKWQLFDFSNNGESFLHKGAFERVTDYARAIEDCLAELKKAKAIQSETELNAVGFKTVIAKNMTGCVRLDRRVLQAMADYAGLAPAHNPAYLTGIKLFAERVPRVPLIALFETAFHQFAPEAAQRYAVPEAWLNIGVRRWGFHGASHRYIAGRMPELLGRSDIKLISCHLGGSSSLSAIKNGQSIGCSLGMSPQSGLPHNNRVGDFDVFALPVIIRATGKSLDEVLSILANQSGLEGLSGAGRDLRDIEAAAAAGDPKAGLAIEVFVAAIRHYLGAFLLELDGADAIVFTGGIGENSARIRSGVCRELSWFGIKIDPVKNAGGPVERLVSAAGSRVQVWTVPTNEEIVVARQSAHLLKHQAQG
jgi:acetate kinase